LLPIQGFYLRDGLNLVVDSETAGKTSTFLCRPDGSVKRLWTGPYDSPLDIKQAPDGTLWTISETSWVTTQRRGKATYLRKALKVLAMTTPGESFEVKVEKAVTASGVYGDISVLRSEGNYLWVNLGDKYLAKVSVSEPRDFKLWPMPRSLRFPAEIRPNPAITASPGGVFIIALKGIYFMDWEGKTRKIG
jgi:hypothetical protein